MQTFRPTSGLCGIIESRRQSGVFSSALRKAPYTALCFGLRGFMVCYPFRAR